VGRYDGTVVAGRDTVLVDANNSITFTLPDAFYGTVTAIATDIAGNDSAEQSVGNTAEDTYDGVVVDSVAPNVNISYEGTLEATILEKNNGELSRQDVTAGADARFVYSSGVVGTITVDEDNFYEEDITVIVTRDDQDVTSEVVGEWSNVLNTSVFTKTIDMGMDGDYVVTVRYTDASGNEMEWSSNAYANKTGVKEYRYDEDDNMIFFSQLTTTAERTANNYSNPENPSYTYEDPVTYYIQTEYDYLNGRLMQETTTFGDTSDTIIELCYIYGDYLGYLVDEEATDNGS